MYKRSVAITPSDTVNLPKGPCDGIYVGGAGNITIKNPSDGTAVLFTAVPVGTILPVKAKIVKSTGTSATALVALYE